MIPGLMGERPAEVLAAIDEVLGSSGTLTVASGELLGLIDEKQLSAMIEHGLGQKPSSLETFRIAMGGLTGGSAKQGGVAGVFDILPSAGSVATIFGHIKHEADRYKYNVRRNAVHQYLKGFSVVRHIVALDNRERALLRGMAAMYADGGLPVGDWQAFYALLAWAGGRGRIEVADKIKASEHSAYAEQLLRSIITHALPGHEQNLADAASRLSNYDASHAPLARKIDEAVSQGARWLDVADVATSRVHALAPTHAALLVGYIGDREDPLYFNGNESLITIGGPGSGKTQAQVIPNLLHYPGSAFVLDVKDELFRATAAVRQRFGPVYRFAPTDHSGASHRYNPFDVISREFALAPVDCQVLANELVPDEAGSRDPYWDRKARQFVWAFAVAVALEAPDEERNLARIYKYLSIPTHFDAQDSKYQRSETKLVVEKLRAIAKHANIEGLASAASAIESGVTSNRLESVFDVARSRLGDIVQTPSAVKATVTSDWSPGQLRQMPGDHGLSLLEAGGAAGLRALGAIVVQPARQAAARGFHASAGRAAGDVLPRRNASARGNAGIERHHRRGPWRWASLGGLHPHRQRSGRFSDGPSSLERYGLRSRSRCRGCCPLPFRPMPFGCSPATRTNRASTRFYWRHRRSF